MSATQDTVKFVAVEPLSAIEVAALWARHRELAKAGLVAAERAKRDVILPPTSHHSEPNPGPAIGPGRESNDQGPLTNGDGNEHNEAIAREALISAWEAGVVPGPTRHRPPGLTVDGHSSEWEDAVALRREQDAALTAQAVSRHAAKSAKVEAKLRIDERAGYVAERIAEGKVEAVTNCVVSIDDLDCGDTFCVFIASALHECDHGQRVYAYDLPVLAPEIEAVRADTPLARGIAGSFEGDIVSVSLPERMARYRIKEVTQSSFACPERQRAIANRRTRSALCRPTHNFSIERDRSLWLTGEIDLTACYPENSKNATGIKIRTPRQGSRINKSVSLEMSATALHTEAKARSLSSLGSRHAPDVSASVAASTSQMWQCAVTNARNSSRSLSAR